MLKRLSVIVLVGALAVPARLRRAVGTDRSRVQPQAGAAAKGPRPEQFTYPPLDFTPPKAAEFRTVLSNGLVVYHRRGPRDPVVRGHAVVAGDLGRRRRRRPRAAAPRWPTGRKGPEAAAARDALVPRAARTSWGSRRSPASVVRSGGTTTMTGEQINERMDFLAGTRDRHGAVHPRAPRGRGAEDLAGPADQPGVPRRPPAAREAGDAARASGTGTATSAPWPAARSSASSTATRRRSSPSRPRPPSTGLTRADLVAWHKKYWGANNADPRRVRRVQEGRDAAEARGHLRQVAERGEGGAARGRRPSRRRSPASTWCSRRARRRTRASSRSATSA